MPGSVGQLVCRDGLSPRASSRDGPCGWSRLDRFQNRKRTFGSPGISQGSGLSSAYRTNQLKMQSVTMGGLLLLVLFWRHNQFTHKRRYSQWERSFLAIPSRSCWRTILICSVKTFFKRCGMPRGLPKSAKLLSLAHEAFGGHESLAAGFLSSWTRATKRFTGPVSARRMPPILKSWYSQPQTIISS